MTFDEWCYSKNIKGNWKEALYHSLYATHEENLSVCLAGYGGDDVDGYFLNSLTQEDWEKEWKAVLAEAMKKLSGDN